MNDERVDEKRREFLKGAVVGGSAAALLGARSAAAAQSAEQKKPDANTKTGSRGYQETEHVRQYYRTAEL